MKLTNNRGGLLVASAIFAVVSTLLIANDFVNGDGFSPVDRQGIAIEETSSYDNGNTYWKL